VFFFVSSSLLVVEKGVVVVEEIRLCGISKKTEKLIFSCILTVFGAFWQQRSSQRSKSHSLTIDLSMRVWWALGTLLLCVSCAHAWGPLTHFDMGCAALFNQSTPVCMSAHLSSTQVRQSLSSFAHHPRPSRLVFTSLALTLTYLLLSLSLSLSQHLC
jgi:hypothetical protein